MRSMFPISICLVMMMACAHQQPPPAKPDRTRELGAMKIVPVAAASESGVHASPAQPTMALSQAELDARPSVHAPKPSAETLPASATPPPRPAASDSDIDLRERVQRTLQGRKSLSYTAQRISVAVKRRNVTLQGDVPTEHEKAEVQHIVEGIEGVRRVRNQLAVIDHRMLPAPDAVH